MESLVDLIKWVPWAGVLSHSDKYDEKLFASVIYVLAPFIIYCIFKIINKNKILPEGYASFELRAIAFVIDLVLIEIITVIIIKITNPVEFLWGAAILIATVLYWVDMAVLPLYTGGSIGKMILHLKIVKKDNKKLNFYDLFVREITKIFCGRLFLLELNYLWMLIGKKQLTWQDSVADTRVITTKQIVTN